MLIKQQLGWQNWTRTLHLYCLFVFSNPLRIPRVDRVYTLEKSNNGCFFLFGLFFIRSNCTVPQMISNRKWSRDRIWSPKWTANDRRPKVIPKVDRKWSRENLGNGMEWILWDWLQKRTDYKKGTFFSRLLKKKERRTLHLRSIYTRRKKKWNKSEKDMVLTVYFFICQLLQFSFKNLRQVGRFYTWMISFHLVFIHRFIWEIKFSF